MGQLLMHFIGKLHFIGYKMHLPHFIVQLRYTYRAVAFYWADTFALFRAFALAFLPGQHSHVKVNISLPEYGKSCITPLNM